MRNPLSIFRRKEPDVLVVGAGYAGAVVAEQLASQQGLRVLIIDKRPHIGGNAYDYHDEHGVLVHKYGPHIFHTHNNRVFRYLSRFTEWAPYEHRVLGQIDNRAVPIPFNFTSLDICFPERADALKAKLVETYGAGQKLSIQRLRESTDPVIHELGEFIFEKVFLHYTTKQWGLAPHEIDPSVLARVPVYTDDDDRYFKDPIQCMPKEGYTRMFERILSHENINVQVDTSLESLPDEFVKERTLVYTGPLDALCRYSLGPLPYRSLRFQLQHYQQHRHQAVAQFNYPDQSPYTRVTEFKHFPGSRAEAAGTTVAIEYPCAHQPGFNEPYYPVITDENRALYDQYVAQTRSLYPHIQLLGRLAEYRYYNMDQVVHKALRFSDAFEPKHPGFQAA